MKTMPKENLLDSCMLSKCLKLAFMYQLSLFYNYKLFLHPSSLLTYFYLLLPINRSKFHNLIYKFKSSINSHMTTTLPCTYTAQWLNFFHSCWNSVPKCNMPGRKRVLPRADTGTGGVAGLGRRAAEEHAQPLVVDRAQTVHLEEKGHLGETPAPMPASNIQHASRFVSLYQHYRGSSEDRKLQGAKYEEEERLIFKLKQSKKFKNATCLNNLCSYSLFLQN